MDAVQYINEAPIKSVFFGHFALITLSLIADWLPSSYLFYNLLFLSCLLWSIHNKDSHEPLFIALVVNSSAILFDALLVGIYWSYSHDRPWFGFSVFMAISNLLLRPITSLMLLRLYNERQGRYSSFGFPGLGSLGDTRLSSSGNHGPSAGRGPYENIDSAIPHQSVPSPIHNNYNDANNDANNTHKPPSYTDLP